MVKRVEEEKSLISVIMIDDADMSFCIRTLPRGYGNTDVRSEIVCARPEIEETGCLRGLGIIAMDSYRRGRLRMAF